MQEEHINKPSGFETEIDLRELFNIILQGKWIISSVTVFVSIIAVIYSLLLPNIYQSEALLSPIKESSGIGGALKNYSALAGFAGISLPANDDDNSAQAIRKISSLSFFENNILKNINLPDLMALKAWDYKTNTLSFDEKVFNEKTGTWVRDYSYPQQQIPSAQESFRKFIKQHLNLSEDKRTGFITLSIKHQSPYIAKQWLELVVDEVNNFYRNKDKLKSQKAVNYLNQQISLTSFSEVKQVLAQLLQEETKKLSLIEANQFYVFEYIDTPAVIEKESEPNRVLICILGALFGGVLSILLVLFRHYGFRERASQDKGLPSPNKK